MAQVWCHRPPAGGPPSSYVSRWPWGLNRDEGWSRHPPVAGILGHTSLSNVTLRRPTGPMCARARTHTQIGRFHINFWLSGFSYNLRTHQDGAG